MWLCHYHIHPIMETLIIWIYIYIHIYIYTYLYIYMYGWWFQPTPLKNDGLRQLGWWHSQLNGKIKNVPNHQPVLYYLWTSWTITSERLMFLGFSWYVLVLRKPSQLNAPMCTDPTSKSRRLQCVRPPRWALATRGGLETLSGRSQNSLVQLGIDPAMFQHGGHHGITPPQLDLMKKIWSIWSVDLSCWG